MRTIVYLSTPYNHPTYNIRRTRILYAQMACCKIVQKTEFMPLCPVIHNNAIVSGAFSLECATGSKKAGCSPETQKLLPFKHWEHLNRGLLTIAKQHWILVQDGWKESAGVQQEMRWARRLELPTLLVVKLDPLTIRPFVCKTPNREKAGQLV